MHNLTKSLAVLAMLGLLAACGDSGETTDSDVEAAAEQMSDAVEAPISSAEEPDVADASSLIDKADPNWKSKVTAPPMMSFESGKAYFWLLETNHGLMKFRLFHEQSPKHVNSTIYLTELGFYDDIKFHRVIPGFMAQGGDPTGTGMGGPAYKYDGEFAEGLSHSKAGMLSMANAGPGTDGSQFFVTFKATPFLDGKHTLFGELTQGMEVLQALEARGSRGGQTTEELKIVKASIEVE